MRLQLYNCLFVYPDSSRKTQKLRDKELIRCEIMSGMLSEASRRACWSTESRHANIVVVVGLASGISCAASRCRKGQTVIGR